MMQNHCLASAISDMGFYEFRRQLEYKCQWYGASLKVVDRFYPSSQICSNCKHQQKMPLKERVYNCAEVCGGKLPPATLRPECGLSIDRDLNASINLEQAAFALLSLSVDRVLPTVLVECESFARNE